MIFMGFDCVQVQVFVDLLVPWELKSSSEAIDLSIPRMNSPQRLKHPQVEEFVYQGITSLHCQHRYRRLLVARSQQERRLYVRVGGCSKEEYFFKIDSYVEVFLSYLKVLCMGF